MTLSKKVDISFTNDKNDGVEECVLFFGCFILIYRTKKYLTETILLRTENEKENTTNHFRHYCHHRTTGIRSGSALAEMQ